MFEKGKTVSTKKGTKMSKFRKMTHFFTARRTAPKYLIIVPSLLFIINIVLTSLAARSGLIIYIAGKELPVSSFAGVLSALGNICLVFLVLFYKKRGFITSVVCSSVKNPAKLNRPIRIS